MLPEKIPIVLSIIVEIFGGVNGDYGRDVKQTSYISSWDPKEVADFHETIGNKETPLVKLPGLAKHLGIGNLLLKDESHRFGLNAFKALGASYAMYRQIEKNPQIKTFCTATDGNHGRAVAWMARKLGRKALIYMPQGTVPARVRAIEKEGAEVLLIDQGYDIAVKMANTRVNDGNKTSENRSWSLIQDTAWNGYEEVPLDIMRGYWTQAHEITKQIGKEKIDVLLLQSGVGSWAASVVIYILKQWQNPPLFIGVEPHSANCLFESIKAGHRVSVESNVTTTMAGLNCGSVSTLAWKILKNGLIGSVSISDKLGCTPETLRAWVKKSQAQPSKPSSNTQSTEERLAVLERENKELKRTNDILRQAAAFFAQAELDRKQK